MLKNDGKIVKVRIAVIVDEDGNWSAAGWKGARDSEAIDMAQDGDVSGLMQAYLITLDVPLPRPIEVSAVASLEEGELILEEQGTDAGPSSGLA